MKNELKQIVDDYEQTFNALCEQSRKEYMETLPPGSPIPEPGKLYTKKAQDSFSNKCQELRTKTSEILGGCKSDISEKLTAPPSTDAVNTVALLNAREHVTVEEYDALLNKYKDNVPAYRAIKDSAVKHGHRGVFKDHPVDEYNQKINDISYNMNNLFSPKGIKTRAGTGYVSLLNAMIDNTFDE